MERFFVLTNPASHWLLPGFVHLFEVYNPGNEIVVLSYGRRPKEISGLSVKYKSIDKETYPRERWSDGLLRALDLIGEERPILMLEDYWLHSHVNQNHLRSYCDYLRDAERSRSVLRLDLSGDRINKKGAHYYGAVDGLEIVVTPPTSPYQMSFQAAIWNADLLKEVLRPGENPWVSEIEGSHRMATIYKGYDVLGAANPPLRYTPIFRSRTKTVSLRNINPKQVDFIRKKGWLKWE